MTPLPVDNLSNDSPDNVVQEAISQSIEACMAEPIPVGTDVDAAGKNKWCAGKVYGMARQKTGKELNFGR